jgi:phosphoribosylglycinamide formyltransferase-1
MVYKFGWFSTGRDEAARELLQIVYDNCRSGFIPGELSFVFCSREKGESSESDAFIDLAESFGLEVLCFSSKKFKHDLWHEAKSDPVKLEQWREEYDREVYKLLETYERDTSVLAGFMLIVSAWLCERMDMVNLHPATPDGPKGSWQEVIWELIEKRSEETGVMMHLVTKDLDRGPPIAFCSFPIRTDLFADSLKGLEDKLENQDLKNIQESEGEGESYFKLVRDEGVRRELPLIIITMRSLAEGKVSIKNGQVYAGDEQLQGGYDLTDEIESYLKK